MVHAQCKCMRLDVLEKPHDYQQRHIDWSEISVGAPF